MPVSTRRWFLKSLVTVGAGALASKQAAALPFFRVFPPSPAADSRIDILLAENTGTIAPQPIEVPVRAGVITHTFPPATVTRLQIQLQ